MKSLPLLIAILIVTSQGAIYWGNHVVLSHLGMNGEFYKRQDIESLKDSLYRTHNASTESYKRDSTIAAVRMDNLINHTISDGKDLSKSYLTLLTAVLVASIAFGEKIVQFSTAKLWAKALLIASWISISIAIALCGLGLIFLFTSQTLALDFDKTNFLVATDYSINFYNKPEYLDTFFTSAKWFLHSGATFVIALIFMMIAGIMATKTNITATEIATNITAAEIATSAPVEPAVKQDAVKETK